MKSFAASLILFFLIPLSTEAALIKSKTVNGKTVEYVGQQVLVCYKPGRATRTRRFLSSQLKTAPIKSLPEIRVDLIEVPDGWSEDDFIKELQKNPDVEFAELNTLFRASFTPDDLQAPYPLGTGFVNMEPAWDITRGNSSVVIAIIDSGVDLEHPDLTANRWINTDETAGNGLDDDNNGYVDDRNGYDFVNQDGNPDDDNFHGTHVAGIAAATANNSADIAGVAHMSQVMALKALNAGGGGDAAVIAEAILYAAANGASVINMSLGGDSQTAVITSAVNVALANNVVVVAAAGNTLPAETTCAVEFPAADAGVIAVGSVDNTNTIADSSCRGSQVDVSAPGVNILSLAAADPGPASGVRFSTGTSMASPMVAGVAALLRSLDPTMSYEDVTKYIAFHSDDLGPAGHDNAYGFGRLNALQTLQAANSGTPFVSNPGFPGESFSYPNPYDPTTGKRVTISLPQGLGSAGLQIRIFNSAGVRVKTLTDTNEWDGKNDDGNAVASGLYFYYAQTNSGDVKGKLTVLR